MLCYIEKERGVGTGFKFGSHPHGNYTFEIKEEKENLVKEGLIEFREQVSQGYWGDQIKTHVFVATDKLKKMELPLSEKEKKAVHSIYQEYKAYSPTQIEAYDHAVYRDNKTRTDFECHEHSRKQTEKAIKKYKGDERAALEEWLSEKAH